MDFHTNGIQHIGLPTKCYDETCAFYEMLGFVRRLETVGTAGKRVAFFELDRSFMMEVYEEDETAGVCGALDHLAIDSADIEATHASVKQAGLKIVSKAVETLPLWDHGVKFLIAEGPNRERIEFCQIL